MKPLELELIEKSEELFELGRADEMNAVILELEAVSQNNLEISVDISALCDTLREWICFENADTDKNYLVI